MTLGTTHASVRYNGDGAIRTFAVTFEFHATTDLEVVVITEATGAESTKALGADYSVTGGDGGTGTVTMNVAPTTAERLVIRRVSPDQQPDDLRDGGPLAAESLERRLDVLAARLQELEMDIARALKVSKGSLATDEGLTLNLTGGRGQSVLVSNNEQGVVLGAGIAPDDVVVSTKGEEFVGLTNEPAMRSFLRLGTAATANIGNHGAVVPLLNANNRFTGTARFDKGVIFGSYFTIKYSDTSGSDKPNLAIERASESPAPNDALGRIIFYGMNTANPQQKRGYASIRCILENPTVGQEESRLEFTNWHGGSSRVRWRINRGIYSPASFRQDMGQGTVNVDGGVYKNGVEYTRGWTNHAEVPTSGANQYNLANNLPNDITEIEVLFELVSTNTTNQPPIVQLGTSAGWHINGYRTVVGWAVSTGASATGATVGIPLARLDQNTFAEGDTVSGIVRMSKWPGVNRWYATVNAVENGTNTMHYATTVRPFGSPLTAIRLTTPALSALFDGGHAIVRYR